jgi:hypothetical protein
MSTVGTGLSQDSIVASQFGQGVFFFIKIALNLN